jgi:hypothetical protein
LNSVTKSGRKGCPLIRIYKRTLLVEQEKAYCVQAWDVFVKKPLKINSAYPPTREPGGSLRYSTRNRSKELLTFIRFHKRFISKD